MRYRKDITDYLIKELGKEYKRKSYKFYEQDGELYSANYDYDKKTKIIFYSCYDKLWTPDEKKIAIKIVEEFNVTFSDNSSDIVCRCGDSKSFSAFYGDYEISLRCNKCGNAFVSYSG